MRAVTKKQHLAAKSGATDLSLDKFNKRCYFSGPLSGKAATEDGSPRIHFDWNRLRARMKSSVTRAAVSTPAALYNAATK